MQGKKATGRKLANPVYAYSLAWAPGETPSPEVMKAAARETLTRLGLDGHEAILVAHNDEPHPAHPRHCQSRPPGNRYRRKKLSCDRLVLSKWAEAYEKAQGGGLIRCEQRSHKQRKAPVAEGGSPERFCQKTARATRRPNSTAGATFASKRHSSAGRPKKKELSTAQKIPPRPSSSRRSGRRSTPSASASANTPKKQLAHRVSEAAARARPEKTLRGTPPPGKRLRHFLREQAKTILHRDRSSRAGFLSAAFQAMASAKPETRQAGSGAPGRAQGAGDPDPQLRAGVRRSDRLGISQEAGKSFARLERAERFELGRKHSSEEQEGAKRIKDGSRPAHFRGPSRRSGTRSSPRKSFASSKTQPKTGRRIGRRPPRNRKASNRRNRAKTGQKTKAGGQDDDTDDKGGDEREASAEEDRNGRRTHGRRKRRPESPAAGAACSTA